MASPNASGDVELLQEVAALVPAAPAPPAMAPGPQRAWHDDTHDRKRPRGNGLSHSESVTDGRAWSLSSGASIVPRCLYKWSSMQAALFEFDLSEHRSLLQRASEVAKPLLKVHPPLGHLYGKPAFMRRNVGFFCEPGASYGYFFSGQLAKANPLPPELRHLLATVNDRFNARYNDPVNYYTNGDYPTPRRRAWPTSGRAHHLLRRRAHLPREAVEPREEGAVPRKGVALGFRAGALVPRAAHGGPGLSKGACARRPAAAGRRRAHLVHPSVSRH